MRLAGKSDFYICSHICLSCVYVTLSDQMENDRDLRFRTQTLLGHIQGTKMPLNYFWAVDAAELTKICILPISATPSPNSKLDFGYFYFKCPKIAIKILKNGKKTLRPIFDIKLHIMPQNLP